MAHKLLLADDSITIQRVIELTCAGQAIDVVAVGDGAEAIARIPQERPDIVLADIGMPGASGYDVAAFVRSRADLAHVSVLLLAGAFEPIDEARARAARCDGVLVKPFEPQVALARVRELLAAKAAARVETPAPGAGAGGAQDAGGGQDAGGALDEYFERISDAVAFRASEPAPVAPGLDRWDDETDEVPTLADLIREEERPAAAGEPDVVPPRPGSGHRLEITDELIDKLAARVIERLAPDAVRTLVAPVVEEIAGRLVRDASARARVAPEDGTG